MVKNKCSYMLRSDSRFLDLQEALHAIPDKQKPSYLYYLVQILNNHYPSVEDLSLNCNALIATDIIPLLGLKYVRSLDLAENNLDEAESAVSAVVSMLRTRIKHLNCYDSSSSASLSHR